MPSLRVTGFQITRTLDQLVYDLLLILRDTLSDPTVDLLHNQDDVDILEFRVLALLSQPLYVKHLLWRDYKKSSAEKWHLLRTARGEKLRIHDEAINYFYKVLRRRLRLAQNLKERLPSMHQLLQAGCRWGPAEPGWPNATIQRDPGLSPRHQDAVSFQRTIEALERQCREWTREQTKSKDAAADTDTDSGIVARRRAEFGPLWLIVADCIAEVIAELALFHDVLRTLPVPLPAEFAEDEKFQKYFQTVVQSLNERYGLLRSCGLDPQRWFDSEALSVNVLEDIKKLRSSVAEYLKKQPDEERYSAYQTGFNTLKGQGTRFAGCKTFSEFVETEVGAVLVWGGYGPLPPDSPTDGGESENDDKSGANPDFDPDAIGDEPTREAAEHYIAQYPELARDTLMSMVVRVAFAGRALDEPEILAEVRRLIAQNDLHRQRFGRLTTPQLVRALYDRAQQIVQRRQQRVA